MTIALSTAGRSHTARAWRRGPTLSVLAACAAFMFFDLRTPPLVLWDESRIAVNALEMRLAGHPGLIATYGFAPDLWNTKPPLLIWLMDLSMALFGVSEWAMRLPSVLAALGTLALTLSFARRLTGSFWTGALAVALLAASIVFFGEHGARTADYEALLCLFTTAYLYVLFFALHRRRPGWRAPLLAGALIALAVLTKSIAGLTPGLGVPLYLALVRRWRRPLQAPWLLGAAPLAALAPAAFYVVREHAGPGYLAAVARNDLAGRYARPLEQHGWPAWYYLDRLFALGGFAGGRLAALAPAAVLWTHGRARLGLLYSLAIAGALIATLSFSATKLLHYAVPAAPFLAVATAIALKTGLDALRHRRMAGRLNAVALRLAQGVVALMLVASLARSAYFRATWLPDHEFAGEALYGALFDRLAERGFAHVRVVDLGVVGVDVTPEGVGAGYAPQLDFYRELAVSRGQDVRRIAPGALAAAPSGTLLASCDTAFTARLRAMGPDLAGLAGLRGGAPLSLVT